MKIESKGIRITDVPGVERIEVEQDSIVIHMATQTGRYSVSQVAQIRNALDTALEEHAKFDTAMTTPNHTHRASCHGPIGELLCGER